MDQKPSVSGLQLRETLSYYHWNVETQRQFKTFPQNPFYNWRLVFPTTLTVVPLDIIFILLAALGVSEGSLVM